VDANTRQRSLRQRQPEHLVLGQGYFLPARACQELVSHLYNEAWWQRSEIGEASESAVDLSVCRSLWCWLSGTCRQRVLRRLNTIGHAIAPSTARLKCEEPVVLRYTRGSFFKRHQDVYARPENAAGRRMSIVVFLTGQNAPGGFQGGELCFYPRPGSGEQCFRIPGRVGQFVVFAPDLEHEVLPVRSGERITLVSWLY
jgi:Rps23 Pro-64 3,4-dihydroxylase Tpa1-like proline 4-hydroxylase